MCRPDQYPPFDIIDQMEKDALNERMLEADLEDDAIYQAYDAWFDEYNQMLRDEALKLGISEGEAALLIYLRERSRWTQEKEDQLIEAAHKGIPWPNILAGEDDEWFAELEK